MTAGRRLESAIRSVLAGDREGVRIVEAVVERLGGAVAAAADGVELREAIGFVVNSRHRPPIVMLRDYMRLDAATQDALFDGGRHVRAGHRWLVLAGRHYDGDCPAGTDSWHALPVFQRLIGEEKP